MIVRIKKDEPRFEIKAGDVFFAERYRYDPDKVTLLKRITDDYDPRCNEYVENLEFVTATTPVGWTRS